MSLIRATNVTGLSGIAATAGQVYSAGGGFYSATATRDGRINLAWYNGAGNFLSRDQGVASPVGAAWTPLELIGVTAPANTAYVSLEIEYDGNVSDEYFADKLILVKGTDIQWSEFGYFGTANFVLERSVDGGVTWEEVVGATHEDPAVTELGVSEATIVDRYIPLRVPVRYRGYVQTYTAPVYSAPTETADSLNMATSWWLRSLTDSSLDAPIKNVDHSRTIGPGGAGTTFFPEGREYPVVIHGRRPAKARFSLNVQTLDKAHFDAAKALLTSRDTLVVQDVLGNLWYVKVTSDLSIKQTRAAPTLDEAFPIRHFFDLNCEVTEVSH
jgi:hypothetical protein